MTSTFKSDIFSSTRVDLRATTFKAVVTSSASMSTDISFVMPPTAGTTGQYLQTNGTGPTAWANLPPLSGITGPTGPSGPTGPNIFPPVPNDDLYSGRTNQLITINVLVGVTGNVGGTDTLGGSLSSPANTITSVTLGTSVVSGTLTNTGLGTYTYRSFPRFTGLDKFTYKITDNTGVTSKNNATCYINIEKLEPTYTGGTGPYFLYSRTGNNTVQYYRNGTVSDYFTAGFTGATGSPLGVTALATNRDDNLIYYTSHTGGNYDRIYAYDYVNNVEMILVNANTSSLFTVFVTNNNFRSAGATYNNKHLFLYPSAVSYYYAITLSPYVVGVAQSVSMVARYTLTALASPAEARMAWDYDGGTLVTTQRSGTNNVLRSFDPISGFLLKSTTLALNVIRNIVTGNDQAFYVNSNGSTTLNSFSVYDGATGPGVYTAVGSTGVISMAEWPTEPTS